MPFRFLLFFFLFGLGACQTAQTPVRVGENEGLELPQVIKATAWECISCQEPLKQGDGYVLATVWTATRIRDDRPVVKLRSNTRNRGYRFAALEYATEGGVGNGNERYLQAYAIGEKNDTSRVPLLYLGRGVKGKVLIPIEAMESIREIGILKTNGGNTYARTTREKLRFYGVTFLREGAKKPGHAEAADSWLARQIVGSKPGDTLDFRGDTFLLEGTVLLQGVDDLTILGGTFYATEPRFRNRGNRDDFFRLIGSHNVRLTGLSIFGTRYGDYRATLESGVAYTAPHWISRHFEPGHGVTNRLDLTGKGSGTLRLYVEGEKTPFLTRNLQLTGDTLPLYFILPDRNARLRLESSLPELQVSIYGKVLHVYESEFSSGIFITNGCRDVQLVNLHVETVMGDGLQIDGSARNTRAEGVTVVGASRQGASVNGGVDTYLADLRLENTGRAGLDVEPYSKDDLVDGLTIRRLVTGNHNFTSFIANNWGQILRLDLDGLESFGEMDGTWLGGANGAVIRNVTGFTFDFDGAGCLLENLDITGTIAIESGKPYEKIPGLQSGNNTLRNFTLHRRNSSAYYILNTGNDATNSFTNGVLRAGENYRLLLKGANTTAYLRGKGRLENVRVEDYERYFPNMILDGRPTRLLTSRPAAQVQVAARFARQSADGKLAAGQSYYYQLAVVPRGQPEVLLGEQSVTIPKGQNVLLIPIKGLADPANGYVYHEFRLYRGTTPGRYDTRFVITPDTEVCGLNNEIRVTDGGTWLTMSGGLKTNSRFFGYPTNKDGKYETTSETLVP